MKKRGGRRGSSLVGRKLVLSRRNKKGKRDEKGKPQKEFSHGG